MKFQIGFLFLMVLLVTSCDAMSSAAPILPRANYPSWSPDGKYIAYRCYLDGPTHYNEVIDYNEFTIAHICIMDEDGSNKRQLVKNAVESSTPVWSPDGSTIVFISDDGLYTVNSQGGNPNRIVEGRGIADPQWSPDGRQLAFVKCRKSIYDNVSTVGIIDKDGSHLTQLENVDQTMLATPRWSPDGNQLAYSSTVDPGETQLCGDRPLATQSGITTSIMLVGKNDISTPKQLKGGLHYFNQLAWLDKKILAYGVAKLGNIAPEVDSINAESITEVTLEAMSYSFTWSPASRSIAHYDVYEEKLRVKDLNSGQAWAVARHDAVGDISVSPDGAQLLIMADEKAPTRLNSVYTETIWTL